MTGFVILLDVFERTARTVLDELRRNGVLQDGAKIPETAEEILTLAAKYQSFYKAGRDKGMSKQEARAFAKDMLGIKT